jgi:DNA-binding NarL/FixJ family response regulator
VEPIRILMVAVPRLVGDIVRCAPDEDVSVVGSIPTARALEQHVEQVGANVVLVGSDERSLPAVCRALLARRPDVKVILIRGDARHATLYELQRRRRVLAQVSPQELVEVLRSVLDHQAGAWRA